MAPNDTEFGYELRIPKERIAILIGKDGDIKKEIEEKTKTKIEIDSESGEIFIKGENGLDIFDAKEVILAIGRGFNPKIALLLLKGDYVFEVINIKDYANSKNTEIRLRGRIIGAEGKSRNTIEDLTECNIAVFGKTASIIGQPEAAGYAKQAIVNLLRGSTHASVFSWLERKRRLLKQKEMMGDGFETTETD